MSHNVDHFIISIRCAGCTLKLISADTHNVVDFSSSSLVNSTITLFLFFFSETVGPTTSFVYFSFCLYGLFVIYSLSLFVNKHSAVSVCEPILKCAILREVERAVCVALPCRLSSVKSAFGAPQALNAK